MTISKNEAALTASNIANDIMFVIGEQVKPESFEAVAETVEQMIRVGLLHEATMSELDEIIKSLEHMKRRSA